ncbi:MAG: TrkA family potassium uptake protein [Dactylosporangium sp.]|nr:TrkA family potassium uptake protein [Dactylosporangium sp.]NNJ62146.1 TrkA family potassium uptake protein [Dactylosporangium sp.]
MHVVIMGCGRVGSILALSVERQGHTVSVIDANPESFRRLGSEFAGDTVTGVGFDRKVLAEAGIERAGGFAAVSSGDNSNIISARLARETFGVPRVVARIYDARRAEVYERLGITTVATVRWTADRILRHLGETDETEVWRDPTRGVAISETPFHARWVGHEIREFERAAGARVAYIMRFGVSKLPSRSMVFQDGDQIFVLVDNEICARVKAVAARQPE